MSDDHPLNLHKNLTLRAALEAAAQEVMRVTDIDPNLRPEVYQIDFRYEIGTGPVDIYVDVYGPDYEAADVLREALVILGVADEKPDA